MHRARTPHDLGDFGAHGHHDADAFVLKEGDRVGVPWLHSACGHCEYCLTSWEAVCAQAQFGGYTKNGGFAEYILAAVKRATDGGAHGVLTTAPTLAAFEQGVGMTRERGTCVLVGLPAGTFPVPLFDVVANCITIRGSFVGTRQDMAEALAFAADGLVHADTELQPLSAINDVLDRLARSDVPSRVVLEFAGC